MSELLFPNNYFKNEDRNGFIVSEVMKRSWAADLEILTDIMDLCKRHSLRMFACYGTLLGAVRENGFIPWDDDIDIGLVGDDYIRFIDIASNELGDKYRILNPYTREWYSMNFTHITDLAEPDFSRNNLMKKHGCPFATGPDVYPYYFIPRNPDEEAYILNLLEKIDYVMALNRQSLAERKADGSLNTNSRLNETIAYKLVELQQETGYEFTTDRPMENQLEILYDQVCRVTEEADADYIARYDEYCKDKSKKFPKNYFETVIDMPFENIYMPVPVGYDAILRARFGNNYIVPQREAAAHDYPYYKKQLAGKDYFEEQLKSAEENINSNEISINETQKENNSSNENSTGNDSKNEKTKLLYHTEIVKMLIHCDNAIEKIKEVLADYSDNEEYEFYWMPGVFPKSNECAWDIVAPDLIFGYDSVLSKYRELNRKIFGINADLKAITDYFDEYLGDEGKVAEVFREAGKKVTIQDYADLKKSLEKETSSGETENEDELIEKISTQCSIAIKDLMFKENGEKKKFVLYINSVSVIFQNENRIIEKIKSVLNTFEEASDDIVLFWYLPDIKEELENVFESSLLEQLNEIKETERASKKVIILNENSKRDACLIADAVYGDPDAIMVSCIGRKKPVMIQNPDIF